MSEVMTTRRARAELMDLVDRLEAAAHDVVPAAAQYAVDLSPEGDCERWHTAEYLRLLQADLQRLRAVVEAVLGELDSPGEGAADNIRPTRGETEDTHRLHAAAEEALAAYGLRVAAVAERQRAAFSRRPACWQRSEAGREAERRIAALEGARIDAIELPDPGTLELWMGKRYPGLGGNLAPGERSRRHGGVGDTKEVNHDDTSTRP